MRSTRSIGEALKRSISVCSWLSNGLEEKFSVGPALTSSFDGGSILECVMQTFALRRIKVRNDDSTLKFLSLFSEHRRSFNQNLLPASLMTTKVNDTVTGVSMSGNHFPDEMMER